MSPRIQNINAAPAPRATGKTLKKHPAPLRLVGKTDDAPSITAHDNADGSITVRIEATRIAPTDELLAFPFGLERASARGVVESGDLPSARIGRRVYARRSDVLALIDKLARKSAKGAPTPPADDYAAIVARATGGR